MAFRVITDGMEKALSETDKTTSEKQNAESSGLVFREKSLAHVTAWKHSRAYLKGSGPIVWMAGVAMLVVVLAIVTWTFFVGPYYLPFILTGGMVS